jgi:monofunctional biosynthetic peptidoglycan transglycosylase
MKLPRRRTVLFSGLIILVLPVVLLVGLPWPWVLRWVEPARTSFMLFRAREAARDGTHLSFAHRPVPLEEIPGDLVQAVLVSEDDRFREHHGVDWKALAEEVHWSGGDDFHWTSLSDVRALGGAVRYLLRHRSELKGRSTITQQLAKNLFFTPERSLVRKVEELVVARRLERSLSKDRILELYLNTAELGPGIFGVDAAARAYFGVGVQRLDRTECASLAATLPHPLTSNPAHRPGRMAWRRNLILQRLAGRGVAIPREPPAVELPPLQVDTVLPDTVLPDTFLPDTVLPDTVP